MIIKLLTLKGVQLPTNTSVEAEVLSQSNVLVSIMDGELLMETIISVLVQEALALGLLTVGGLLDLRL